MSINLNVLAKGKLLCMTTDSVPFKNLSFKSTVLQNVYEISITEDFIILTTESNNETIKNNIDAYDWNGNHLWNISDIVGDLKIPYFGGTVTTKDIMKNH